MDLALAGMNAVVGGGSRGIGLATATTLAQEGASVVIVGRDRLALDTAHGAIVAEVPNARVAVHVADLASTTRREELASAASDADILVNNAGAVPGGDLDALSIAEWREAWELKVFGYIHLTQLFLARMRGRGGVIVNVIGDLGRAPKWDYICGSTANAGLIAFTETVGATSVDLNVRVLGVNPTATRTERVTAVARQRAESSLGDPERWREILADRPLGRLAEPAEVARLIAFLAAPAASYVSGTVIDIDGGFSHRR